MNAFAFLLNATPPHHNRFTALFQSCGISLTVKHILVEFPNLRDTHEKYFTVSSLADLFNRFDNHAVIDFIKETHFYHQL